MLWFLHTYVTLRRCELQIVSDPCVNISSLCLSYVLRLQRIVFLRLGVNFADEAQNNSSYFTWI